MSSSQAFIHRHVNEHGACSKGRWTTLDEIMKLEGRGGLRSDREAAPAVDACGHSGCKQRRPIDLKENQVFFISLKF